jgi:hypothetical protein
MDQVKLTRSQLRALVKGDADVVITATNEDAGLILVEPLKFVGTGKQKWMGKDGRYQTHQKNAKK